MSIIDCKPLLHKVNAITFSFHFLSIRPWDVNPRWKLPQAEWCFKYHAFLVIVNVWWYSNIMWHGNEQILWKSIMNEKNAFNSWILMSLNLYSDLDALFISNIIWDKCEKKSILLSKSSFNDCEFPCSPLRNSHCGVQAGQGCWELQPNTVVAELSLDECCQWLAFTKASLVFCKNICTNLTWLQLFPAVSSQCFLAPFMSSGCSEGNEWQCWYLIYIKSIKSPFPSPAVIHSPMPSQEKNRKQRE